MDQAKRDEAPLKVHMEAGIRAAKNLDPARPAKKKPILADVALSSTKGFHKLKPGMPVKKRVTPWLLAEPISVLSTVPR